MVFFFLFNLLSKPQDRVWDLQSVQSEPQLKPTTQVLSDTQEFALELPFLLPVQTLGCPSFLKKLSFLKRCVRHHLICCWCGVWENRSDVGNGSVSGGVWQHLWWVVGSVQPFLRRIFWFLFLKYIISYSLRPKLFGLYFILGCPKIMSCLKSQTLLIYYPFYALNLFVGAFFFN